MLWLCTKKELLDNIQAAADYYHQKYGRKPELCLVHPNMLKDQSVEIEGIVVRPWRPVLPGHLWIGIEDKPVQKESVPA
jgi:hypothetical protein